MISKDRIGLNLTYSSNYILLKTVYICIKIKSKKERDRKQTIFRYF